MYGLAITGASIVVYSVAGAIALGVGIVARVRGRRR